MNDGRNVTRRPCCANEKSRLRTGNGSARRQASGTSTNSTGAQQCSAGRGLTRYVTSAASGSVAQSGPRKHGPIRGVPLRLTVGNANDDIALWVTGEFPGNEI